MRCSDCSSDVCSSDLICRLNLSPPDEASNQRFSKGLFRVKRPITLAVPLPAIPRRRFVQGLAAGGVLLGLSPYARALGMQSGRHSTGSAQILSGNEFNLEFGESPVNLTGSPRMAPTLIGSLPIGRASVGATGVQYRCYSGV